MNIYCTFDGGDSTLRADEYYCISQWDNLSSLLVVKCVNMPESTIAPTYYLDFACFDTRGVLKAKFTSPALTADLQSGNISFAIPNCLTQYEGYVGVQLVMCSSVTGDADGTIVRKSVAHEDRLFDVAPSVNAAETHVLQSPSVFLEVQNAIEELKSVKLRRVAFFDYDRKLKDCVAVCGGKLTAPQFTPPSGTTSDGWYCRNTGELWDFENDVVPDGDEDIELFAEYYNSDATVSGQTMYFDYLGESAPDIYVPFAKANAVKFSLPRASVNSPHTIALSDTVDCINYGVASDYRVPHGTSVYRVCADGLVDASDGTLLAARLTLGGELRLTEGASAIEDVLTEMPVVALDLGDNVRTIATGALTSEMMQILRIGKRTESIDLAAFYAPNLHHVIVDRAIPPEFEGIGDYVAADAKLYVPAGAVARYQQSEGFGYVFSTITTIESATDMAIDEDELAAAQAELDDYNAGQ